LPGIFRGLAVTIGRETPSYGVYFACFEGLRRYYGHFDSDSRSGVWRENAELIMAGGISGIAAWMSTYPLDVIKTRIQGQALVPAYPTVLPACANARQAFQAIVKEEGFVGLFRGTNATVIRAFPTNAVIFTTYALTMGWLTEIRPSTSTKNF
jgi:solute carrier family 25 carnitine/acylcarnitine transporter 20/29